MGPKVTVRPARVDELPATTDLRHAMVAELSGRDLDDTSPGWRERHIGFYALRIPTGRAEIFLAEVDGKSVGITAVYLLDNHRSEIFRQKSAIVSNVYVMPSRRRQGVAAALMERSVQWARDHDCPVVRLRSSTVGRPLYEALGFRATEELELRLDEPQPAVGSEKT